MHNLDHLLQPRGRLRTLKVQEDWVQAIRRADKSLLHRLTYRQRRSWNRHGWFSQEAHGRRYIIDGNGFVYTVINRHEYRAILAPLGYGYLRRSQPQRIKVKLQIIAKEHLPTPDKALINLLLLRYDPDSLWKIACINNMGAYRRKQIRICIAKNCRWCNGPNGPN